MSRRRITYRPQRPVMCDHLRAADSWVRDVATREGLECARCLLAERREQGKDRRGVAR